MLFADISNDRGQANDGSIEQQIKNIFNMVCTRKNSLILITVLLLQQITCHFVKNQGNYRRLFCGTSSIQNLMWITQQSGEISLMNNSSRRVSDISLYYFM